ncbi:TetR/AcrR family transcriptional regulator [Endozoicomonas numazuensis]|uniref:TetR/AcrR family transcriptional regulator n=1 Tax=Endozoicomonas numazuensis TaxID=1137799 RepID=UPI00068FCE31|nr:TetR/AcrR family transcriptional regulator [Endozoicomonas numazuensis]
MNACVEEKKLTKGERTAQKILDESERLFAEKGYEATSLREVAGAVGIREPGLYRHFSGKEDLYQKVLERALKPLSDTLGHLLSGQRQISQESLPVVMFDLLSQSPHIASLLQQCMTGRHGSHSGQPWLEDWLRELIDQGRAVFHHLGMKKDASELEVVLIIVTLFNISTGYFSSAQTLEKLTGKPALSEDSLVIQRKLLSAVAGGLFTEKQ